MSAEPSNTYLYRPLNKTDQEFRLLQLLPLPKSPQAPLQCRMKLASLKRIKSTKSRTLCSRRNREYEAISYTWGDPTPNCVIQVDGKSLCLPSNSVKVLRRMALPDRRRVVYIDAVCINQADLAERASQVLLMGDIYRYGQSTLVYLGDADETTARAFSILRLLHVQLREEVELSELWRTAIEEDDFPPNVPVDQDALIKAKYGELWQTTIEENGVPSTALVDQDALIRLYGRAWFHFHLDRSFLYHLSKLTPCHVCESRRVWVIQEVALAAKSTVICGSEEADMMIVLETAALIADYHAWDITPALFMALANATSMWNLAIRDSALDLWPALRYSVNLSTSDLRDKVFGMLGLLRRSKIDENLIPDYTKPVSHVFRDATRQCVADGIVLPGLLASIDHRDDYDLMDNGWPSWIHRFDRSGNAHLNPMPLEFATPGDSLGEPTLTAQAAARTANEPDILTLPGLHICSVLEVSTVLGGDFDQNLSEVAVTWINKASIILQSHGISMAAAARTLIADEMASAVLRDPLAGLSFMLQHDQKQIAVPTLEEPYQNSSTRLASEFRHLMTAVCGRRRLAVMSNGKAGLGPRLTKSSDQVVMIHGGSFPVVLRPRGDDFSLLGICYVDGWMPWQEHGYDLEQRMIN